MFLKNVPNEQIVQEIILHGFHVIIDQDGWETVYLTVNDRYPEKVARAIMLELAIQRLNLYEIYVYNNCDIVDGIWEGKKAGEIGSWEIKHVLATPEGIKTFPWFDCILSTNDNSTGYRTGAIIWR